jgi:phosphomannomutase/phosphoglucomutase
MDWQNVSLLFAEVDGSFPNHEADPIKLKNMKVLQQEVMRTGAVGIGFDGDVDRMAPIAHDGELVSGDKLLAVFSKKIVQDNPGAAVVYDIKASGGLGELIAKWGGKPVMSPTGHSNVRDQMKLYKASVAGELSCHFFFEDRYFGYDDGIYAMMRLLEILDESKQSLHDLIAEFPIKCSSPEFRIECKEEDKQAIIAATKKAFEQRPDAQIATVDGVRIQLPYGWGLVRQSNTQAMMSIRFEANTPADLATIKEEFVAALQGYFDAAWLRQQFDHEA